MPTKKTQGQDAQGGKTLAGLVIPSSVPKHLTSRKITQLFELKRDFMTACMYNGMNNIATLITMLFPYETFLVVMGVSPRETCIEAVKENLMKTLVLAYGDSAKEVYDNLLAKMANPHDPNDPSNDTVRGIDGGILEDVKFDRCQVCVPTASSPLIQALIGLNDSPCMIRPAIFHAA